MAATLYISQYRLKQTVYDRLKNEHIVCLTFSYEQAKETEPGTEIKVNGKMLDVTQVCRLQDKVLVYGCYDEAEDLLNDELASVVNQQGDKEEGDDLIIKVLQLLMMPYASRSATDLQPIPGNTSPLYISFIATITMVYLQVATPPPLCG